MLRSSVRNPTAREEIEEMATGEIAIQYEEAETQSVCVYTHVNERCNRKEERSKQGQTHNKAKQHSICMSPLEAHNIEVSVAFVRMEREGVEGKRRKRVRDGGAGPIM